MATCLHGLAYLGQLVNIHASGSNVMDFGRARMLAQFKVNRENADHLDTWIMAQDAKTMVGLVANWKASGKLPDHLDLKIRALLNSVLEVYFHFVNSSKLQAA